MTENLDCYGRRGKLGKNQMTLTPMALIATGARLLEGKVGRRVVVDIN
jgi:hypothetical protein